MKLAKNIYCIFFSKIKYMHIYTFLGTSPLIKPGQFYYFSTPKTTKYLLSVSPQLVVINNVLKKFISRIKTTIQYKKKMRCPLNLRRRECGLRPL